MFDLSQHFINAAHFWQLPMSGIGQYKLELRLKVRFLTKKKQFRLAHMVELWNGLTSTLRAIHRQPCPTMLLFQMVKIKSSTVLAALDRLGAKISAPYS